MGKTEGIPSWSRLPARSVRMHLSIEKEDGSISIHPVDQQAAYVIGRNKKECDIVCDHKSCSRKHACIAHHPEGKVYLVDLGSAHGTTVNGRELESESQAELIPSESSFSLGSCFWIFRLRRGPASAASRPLPQEHKRKHHRAEDRGTAGPSGTNTAPDRGYPSQSGRTADSMDAREFKRSRHHAAEAHANRSHRQRTEAPHPFSDLNGSAVQHPPPSVGGRLPLAHHEAELRHRHRSRSGRDEGTDGRQHPRNEFEVGGSEPATRRHRSRPGRSQGFDDGPGPRPDVHGSAPEAVATVKGPAGPAPFVAPLSIAEQKKKLLWGKKADPMHPNGAEEVYGANRWDTAKFASEADKQKFIKLMGAQSGPQPAAAAELEDVDERDHHREVLTGEQQVKVLTEVETHFMQGLRRADGRKVGLGL